MELPQSVRTLIQTLQSAGYEAYAVGGCVRDPLLGRVPHDWDMTTDALPDAMRIVFHAYRTVDTGIQHGTLTVLTADGPIEITTYRIDGAYADHRHPDRVQFTDNLTADLARRDFTVNAMAYRDSEIVDPFGGQADLRARCIRCVGDPARRFDEDALRILRALRFASVLSFSIEPRTAAEIHRQCGLLSTVAAERIGAEWTKLIGGDAEPILRDYPDVIARIFPPLRDECADPARWARRIARVMQAETGLGRTALLLRGCPEAIRALRYDRKTEQLITALTAMPDFLPEATPVNARRGLAQGETLWTEYLRMFPVQVRAPLEAVTASVKARGDCVRTDQLAIRGAVLTELGIRGAAVGKILHILLDRVIDGTLPNRPDALLAAAQAESQHLSP